jgi:uncharacterized membrane-anchored protein
MLAERPRRRFRRRNHALGIEGVARVDRRTKNLLLRIRSGEIAIIAHDDIDAVSAEGLAERDVAAVVNCHRSFTGRYPNAGPLVLANAGIPLIDAAGDELLDRIKDGDVVRVDGGVVFAGDEPVAEGTPLTPEGLQAAFDDARASLGDEIERFVRNTMEYLQSERDLVLSGEGLPKIRTQISGRPVVVVVRGHEHRKDIRALRSYVREMRPVLVAVDGAADTLLDEKLKPDLIIGDMDSVSADALTCGAEIVVHAYKDGRAPGLERVRALGVEPHVFASIGTSEDIALLVAYEYGADLIVAVGAHDNLVEFLDKDRGGMASTFLVRLRVGPKLVDAKRVNRLYRSQIRLRDSVLLIAAMIGAWCAMFFASPALRLWVRGIFDSARDFFRSLF